jgi:GTP-binding protein
LELKLLADVGLVGFPNAGKSTLLSVVSAAKPEIADYPFTTLVPDLGIVKYRGHRSFVMADIPGIIEGAAEGKGLGIRFLRHIERNAVLLFMVPSDTDDIKREYEILSNELATFNPDLVEKPRVLAITKCDLIDEELKEMLREGLPSDVPVVFISSVAQQGLTELKDILWRTINDEHNRIPDTVALHDLDEQHRVQEEDDFIFAAEDPDYDDMPDAGGKMVVDEQEWDDEYWEEKYKDQDRDFQIINDEDK